MESMECPLYLVRGGLKKKKVEVNGSYLLTRTLSTRVQGFDLHVMFRPPYTLSSTPVTSLSNPCPPHPRVPFTETR